MVTPIDSGTDLKIYEHEKHFKVYAGPGAGKTHLLIENIKSIINNSTKIKKDGRKILCITYTNAATDEIKRRLGNYNKYTYVSTIHAFLYDSVLRTHSQQLRHQISKQYSIELLNTVKLVPRIEGFSLLAKTKKEKIVEFLKTESGIDNVDFDALSKSKMSNCILDIDGINKYPFTEKVVPIKGFKACSPQLAKAIKHAIWAEAQVLDFDEILYFSYLLIKEYRHIRFLLQYQFPYIFVDEYQDTNPIQNAVIKLFADCESCAWGVVGDIAQSIYGFAGATYKEFETYNCESKETLEFSIADNRRSTEKITQFISYLRQKDTFIPKQKCIKNIGECKPITILLDSSGQDIYRHLPQGTVILCRSSVERFAYIDGIPQEQQKVLKGISDTYQFVFGSDMYKEIENNSAEWIRLCTFVVQIKKAAEFNCMATIIDACKEVLKIELFIKPTSEQSVNYKKFLILIKKVMGITRDETFFEIERKINEWLVETGMMNAPFAVPKNGDDYYNDKLYESINNLTYKTIEKMVNEVFSLDSKLLTIHKAKGLEFDKVMVNIEPFASENKLFNYIDILKNPLLFSDESKSDEITEYTRVVYVGLSRAINELYLHIKTSESNKIKEELDNAFTLYMTKENIIEKFYEIIQV